jgi:hypothetical protein
MKFFLFTFSLGIASIAWTSLAAQHIFSSPYSVYGIGLINENYSSLNRTLGGTGISLQDSRSLNHLNPASYGSIQNPVSHIFEIGTYLESNRLRTSSASESKSNGGLTNMAYWFKFKPWWSSVMGITPFSTTAYNITMTQTLGVGSDAAYTFQGSGNVTRLYSGNSFTIIKHLSVGFNASYQFGSIKRNETISSLSNEPILTLSDKSFVRGFNLDFGVQYKFNIGKRSLIVGAVYDNKLSLKGKSNLTLLDQKGDTLSTEEGERSVYSLPGYAGAGISLNSKRSVVSLDMKFTQWSSASYDNQNTSFRDVARVAFGYAYLGNDNGISYASMIGFRTGVYFQPYPLALKGKSFNTMGAAMGFSFPVFDGKSSINFTYTYDQMGTLGNGLISQRAHKFVLDVVIRDFWGVRRKFD